MAFGFCFGVALLLYVWASSKCDHFPFDVHMECHDRYFMIAIGLSFAGNKHRFEAVDRTGAYAITKQHAAECGYSVRVLPFPGDVELRASYFSCHTGNKDDEVFTFNFNLLVNHDGKEAIYALNKTCSPSLPWSPREVTCEHNYMEVSVKSDVSCSSEANKADWDTDFKPGYFSTAADWQVMLQRDGEQLTPMNLSEARNQGYVIDLTGRRLVFRTPYGQPDSFSTEVDGVPVEMVHATVFSRHSWVVRLVDLVAACSMHEGSYDGSGYMMWDTPEVLYPSLYRTQISVGLNNELVEQRVAEERGYIVETLNDTVHISIPCIAKGGYRKSFASGDLYEYYIYHLYLEQISVNEYYLDTRLRVHRELVTPLLPRLVFTEDRTVPEERMFTVYLGDVPEDVGLASVQLNGREFSMPVTNASSYSVTDVAQPNNTHGYTLKVPFDDPVVIQQFSKEDGAMQHRLDINYTLTVWPRTEPYYHATSVMASTVVSPPAFDAVCLESGISFKLDHQPSNFLWEITIGSDLLTLELASQRGYTMSNDSRSLLLNVPLFTHGYEYENVTLNGFFGTFEILVRDRETSAVRTSTVKKCLFARNELIMCSTDGTVTVVADLSLAASSGVIPASTYLIDKYCGPTEVDNIRALFSFSLNSCGSIAKLNKDSVTYENEIFWSQKLHSVTNLSSDCDGVVLQCTYPLAGLHRLFSVYKFESDTVGVGRIVHPACTTEDLPSPTESRPVPTKRPARLVSLRPSYHPPAQYIKVSSFLKLSKKGVKRPSQSNMNTALKGLRLHGF